MSTAEITRLTLASMRDTLGNGPRVHIPTSAASAFSPQSIGPRFSQAPFSWPSIAGSLQTFSEFANDQLLVGASGGFQNIQSIPNPVPPTAGSVTVDEYGARFRGGSLDTVDPPTGYLVGVGHYWEEGLITLQTPIADAVYLGNDSGAIHRGRLSIKPVSGVLRFHFEQANASGSGITEYVFDSIPVPLSSQGPANPYQPIYYRFIRNLPTTGGGRLQLRTYSGSTAYTQEITGVEVPVPLSTSTQQLGGAPQASLISENFVIAWWRSQGSDVDPTGNTFGFSDFWSAPVAFETAVYTSNGSQPWSFIDSGVTNSYWNSIIFNEIFERYGGTVGLRVSASNTLPSGTASGFTGSPTTLSSGNAIALSSIQGRYLAIELTFTPSTSQVVSWSHASIVADPVSAIVGTAVYDSAASSGPTVEISFAGEGTAASALPYVPQSVGGGSERFRVSDVET